MTHREPQVISVHVYNYTVYRCPDQVARDETLPLLPREEFSVFSFQAKQSRPLLGQSWLDENVGLTGILAVVDRFGGIRE